MFVPKFRGNGLRDINFRSQKLSGNFDLKSGFIQKRQSTTKNIPHGYMSLNTPFIPTNPLLAAMSCFSFFFFLF